MFDLEEFKRVGWAMDREGRRVKFVAHVPRACPRDRLVALRWDGTVCTYGESGRVYADATNDYDLVSIWRPTITINGAVIVAPETEALPKGVSYFSPDLSCIAVQEYGWEGDWFDVKLLKHGLVWLDADAAQNALTAILAVLRGEPMPDLGTNV